MTTQRIQIGIGILTLIVGGYLYAGILREEPVAEPVGGVANGKPLFDEQGTQVHTDCNLRAPKRQNIENDLKNLKAKNQDNSLRTLDAKERASLKGCEIAKIKTVPKGRVQFSGADYEIEIVEMNPIQGGVEVFARAWTPDGQQIGFGSDGTVDIERFRFFNPPILVSDPNGNIVREQYDEMLEATTTRRLREDPLQAITQSLVHTISLKKDAFTNTVIQPDKRGNTTSTFYSITNGDGTIFSGTSAYSQAGFDTEHDRATGTSVERGANAYVSIYYSPAEARTRIRRGFVPFDTSAIVDSDTISSATVSVWGYMESNSANTNSSVSWVNVVQTTQASSTSLSTADYDACGAINNPTEGATRILYSAMPATSGAAAYIDWTLDATGRGWVDKTGVTKLGLRDGSDATDTWTSGLTGFDKWNAMRLLYSDAAGTTNDPKLVVEHTASGGSVSAPPQDVIYY